MTNTRSDPEYLSGQSPDLASPMLIDAGRLDSLAAMVYNTAEPLKKFSEGYAAGGTPRIVWDLRGLVERQMSMAALTAFLAVAYRLRQFVPKAAEAKLRWSPSVFGFLDDTDFFKIVKANDLITFPEEILGGYWHVLGKTSPSTKFLMFPEREAPPYDNQEQWTNWKDNTRTYIRNQIRSYTGEIFKPSVIAKSLPRQLEQVVTQAAAELALNSIMWGETAAFVGVQRSPARISVAVCDSGLAFLHSLRHGRSRGRKYAPTAHVEALVLASILNQREYGLRRVIEEVVENNGWVSLWSYDGEVHWRRSNWSRYRDIYESEELTRAIEPSIRGRVDARQKEAGYFRHWSQGLRGARISFEIPLGRE